MFQVVTSLICSFRREKSLQQRACRSQIGKWSDMFLDRLVAVFQDKRKFSSSYLS